MQMVLVAPTAISRNNKLNGFGKGRTSVASTVPY